MSIPNSAKKSDDDSDGEDDNIDFEKLIQFDDKQDIDNLTNESPEKNETSQRNSSNSIGNTEYSTSKSSLHDKSALVSLPSNNHKKIKIFQNEKSQEITSISHEVLETIPLEKEKIHQSSSHIESLKQITNLPKSDLDIFTTPKKTTENAKEQRTSLENMIIPCAENQHKNQSQSQSQSQSQKHHNQFKDIVNQVKKALPHRSKNDVGIHFNKLGLFISNIIFNVKYFHR